MEKTAMQELIEYLKQYQKDCNLVGGAALELCIRKATEIYLPKEKSQIEDAYDRGHDTDFELAEDYYNQKYT